MKNRKLNLFQKKTDAQHPSANIVEQKNETKQEERKGSYRDIFLVNDRSKNRVSANISRELFERIRKFLPMIAPDITLTSYLNNVISEHLENHWDEIRELYNSETEKPL